MRFHTLPESKRYAENEAEYAEILRRHRTIIAELLAGHDVSSLVVVAEEWQPADLASGWSKRQIPHAWPWRIFQTEPDPDPDPVLGYIYCWVRLGMDEPLVNALLRSATDDQARFLLADPELNWLYCPYDGGADVLLPSPDECAACETVTKTGSRIASMGFSFDRSDSLGASAHRRLPRGSRL